MILHIVPQENWQSAARAGEYRPHSLISEGFIHCSTREQVLGPANDLYRGQHGLVLLVIDPQKVAAEIVYEDCYESGVAFPHIYGVLQPDAVVAVVDFPPNADGSFSLPPDVAALDF